jgi:DNA-binding LacI/PurR family transcriptional regulator
VALAKRRPTSVDVARSAGVSQATVSLVFSGSAAGRVSEATRARVKEAADALGYRPHAAARTLRLGRANTIALVVPDIRNPFFAAVLHGASEAARQAGVTVVLLDVENHRRQWQARARAAMAAGALDGLLLSSLDPPTSRADLKSRLVLLDAGRSTRMPSVKLDVQGGTTAALRHLLDLGHRRIAHLGSSIRLPTFIAREDAYHGALRKAGLGALDMYAPLDPEAARPTARDLLEQDPTAVFCDDDLLAAGLYKAARDIGLSIPGDVSVVGFDDIALARLLEPELTTVAVPAERLGADGVRQLLALLNGTPPTARAALALKLIVRGSTAPPRL